MITLASCSVNKPTISSFSYKRLVVELDDKNVTEHLSVFLHFKDEDGINDYDSMTLIQKDMRLYWHITRDITSFFKSDYDDKNSLLLGTNKIAHPFGKIPLGKYELQVLDLQGNKVVHFFSIDDESSTDRLSAYLTIEEDRWQVIVEEEMFYSRFYLLLLGADKQPLFLKTLSIGKNSNTSDSINLLKDEWPDARYLQLCAENESRTQGYLANPIEIK